MTQRLRLPSPRYEAVVKSVTFFRQLTTSQIRRVHFMTGTEISRIKSSQRTLRRLVELGELARIPRPFGGYNAGSGEFIYHLPPKPNEKGRQSPALHTWYVAELWVRLVELLGGPDKVDFWPEKRAYTRVGHILLKPDAYVKIGEDAYFIEMDLQNESEADLTVKLNRYVQAVKSGYWPKDQLFPPVLWVVERPAHKRYIQQLIHKLRRENLSAAYLVDELPYLLKKG
jgi:hypothetical protein